LAVVGKKFKMTDLEHLSEAKKCISYLIKMISLFKGGKKYITYGDLAKEIGYPEPHKGSNFGKRIGKTLGTMGHLFDDIEIPDWKGKIPYLQAIVVGKNSKLPSDGLKEFNQAYPNYSNEKKRDYINKEYRRIFEFGERWFLVLKELDIQLGITKSTEKTKFNPFGSEGSPEHRKLRDHIANTPKLFNMITEGHTEYPLKSGDSIDVVFTNENSIIGVEVKSIRSGEDDLERGIFQCIKYREVLKAEDTIKNRNRMVDCILVYEDNFSKSLETKSKKLNVKTMKLKIN
jgi:hypothetical protein